MKKLTTILCTLVLSVLLSFTVYAKGESITVKYEDYNNLSTEEKAKIEKGVYNSEVGYDNTVTLVYKEDDTKCKMPTPNTPKQPSPKGTVDTSETPIAKYVYLLAGSAFLIVIFTNKNRKVKQFAVVLMTISLLFAGQSTSLVAQEKAIGDVVVLDNLQLGEKIMIEPMEVKCYTYEGYTKVANTGAVVVNYVDLEGNQLLPQEKPYETANVGTDYDVTGLKKTVIEVGDKKYQYVDTTGEETGKIIKGEIVVVHKYQQVGSVVVRFFKKGTNEKLRPDYHYITNKPVGEVYDISSESEENIPRFFKFKDSREWKKFFQKISEKTRQRALKNAERLLEDYESLSEETKKDHELTIENIKKFNSEESDLREYWDDEGVKILVPIVNNNDPDDFYYEIFPEQKDIWTNYGPMARSKKIKEDSFVKMAIGNYRFISNNGCIYYPVSASLRDTNWTIINEEYDLVKTGKVESGVRYIDLYYDFYVKFEQRSPDCFD